MVSAGYRKSTSVGGAGLLLMDELKLIKDN